jgi:hypothetical protein
VLAKLLERSKKSSPRATSHITRITTIIYIMMSHFTKIYQITLVVLLLQLVSESVAAGFNCTSQPHVVGLCAMPNPQRTGHMRKLDNVAWIQFCTVFSSKKLNINHLFFVLMCSPVHFFSHIQSDFLLTKIQSYLVILTMGKYPNVARVGLR